MKRLMYLFIFIGLIVSISCTSKSIKTHKEKPGHFTILYINDYHGHIRPFKAHFTDEHKVGGMARIATVIKSIKQENADKSIPTIFLCAGDVLQGTPMSTMFKGEPDFICLNKIGLNGMVVGNHEFDYGQENLNKLRKLADFPILGGNVVSERGNAPVFTSFFTRNIRGIHINTLGLVTEETPITTHPKNVVGLLFLNPIATSKNILAEKKPEGITIALTHLGFDVDKKLAESTEGIDIIIGGHSHTKVDTPFVVNNTIICQAYEYGEFVGRLDLDIEDGKIVGFKGELIPVTEDIEEDSTVKTVISEYAKRLDKKLDEVIGKAISPLDGERENVRARETNLGDFVADVLREVESADIAFVNAGSIRASIDRGDITAGEVINAFPFGGHLVTMKLTGSEILKIVNHFANIEVGSGGFLQISGMKTEISNAKIKSLGIAGKQIELDKLYKVATNDFLAAGGDGYITFKKGKEYIDTGLVVSDILIEHIKVNKVISVDTDGRIKKD